MNGHPQKHEVSTPKQTKVEKIKSAASNTPSKEVKTPSKDGRALTKEGKALSKEAKTPSTEMKKEVKPNKEVKSSAHQKPKEGTSGSPNSNKENISKTPKKDKKKKNKEKDSSKDTPVNKEKQVNSHVHAFLYKIF